VVVLDFLDDPQGIENQIRAALADEPSWSGTRYGLPFLATTPSPDKIEIVGESTSALWYRALDEDELAASNSTRLTTWIDRQDMSRTRPPSTPGRQPSAEIPSRPGRSSSPRRARAGRREASIERMRDDRLDARPPLRVISLHDLDIVPPLLSHGGRGLQAPNAAIYAGRELHASLAADEDGERTQLELADPALGLVARSTRSAP